MGVLNSLDSGAAWLYNYIEVCTSMTKRKAPLPEEFLPLSLAAFHILLSLGEGERHGYALKREMARRTDDALNQGPGT